MASMFSSTSGPLPMSVAPRTGVVILPFSMRYPSATPNTNSPVAGLTWPPESDLAYRALGVSAMIWSALVRARAEVGVGHARIGQVAVVLPPAVAGERQPEMSAPQPIGEVAGEDARLDDRGLLAGRAFVVAPGAAPQARGEAVVVGEHMLARPRAAPSLPSQTLVFLRM